VLSHLYLYSVSFGSSQTDGWLLRFAHFQISTRYTVPIEKQCTNVLALFIQSNKKSKSAQNVFADLMCVLMYTKHFQDINVHRCAQKCSFIFPPCAGMVRGPYHGPRIDVEQPAATSRLVMAIANPSRVMRTLQLSPCMRDCTVPVLTEGHQCQAAENIFDRDDVHHRLGFGLIKELCSRISGLPPPVWLSPAGRGVEHIRT